MNRQDSIDLDRHITGNYGEDYFTEDEEEMKPTKVVFRVFKDDGSVIALFPDEEWSRLMGECSSYMHVGQHGGADYTGVISISRPATEAEYKPLQQELESIGYKLIIRKRR